MLRSHTRMFCIGFATVVAGFGAGWAALVTTNASPLPVRTSSAVSATAGASVTERAALAQPPASAPIANPAPERTAEALRPEPPAPGPVDATPKKSRTELRFDAEDGKSSVSFDPEGRRLRVRLPFGNFDFDL